MHHLGINDEGAVGNLVGGDLSAIPLEGFLHKLLKSLVPAQGLGVASRELSQLLVPAGVEGAVDAPERLARLPHVRCRPRPLLLAIRILLRLRCRVPVGVFAWEWRQVRSDPGPSLLVECAIEFGTEEVCGGRALYRVEILGEGVVVLRLKFLLRNRILQVRLERGYRKIMAAQDSLVVGGRGICPP